MDLLFKRYASPFLLLDTMIESNRLSEFIDTIYEQDEDDKLWEMYLSTLSVYLYSGKAQSFNEFVKQSKQQQESEKMTKQEIEATVQSSRDILNSFVPNE